MLPHDLPPWQVVYQQMKRLHKAGVFETMIHDLRAILRLLEGLNPDPKRPSSTAARSRPQQRGEAARAMMGPRNASGPRPMWQLTR